MTKLLEPRPLKIAVEGSGEVSALAMLPPGARALYVLAHGAGAGMHHPFMGAIAAALAARGVGTLRYQFPYLEAGGRRPDSPRVAHAAVRAAVAEARRLAPRLPLVAGGKSFGGRMTSQAEAIAPLGVRGLAFLGFPLHPPGRPGTERADHLADVHVPMLFLQGTRDEFAGLDLLRPLVEKLGDRATLHLVEGGDHSFRVPAAAGRKPAEIMAELADTLAGWVGGLSAP
jgi:predicted alpha/beta-hydrolase family hydrolase